MSEPAAKRVRGGGPADAGIHLKPNAVLLRKLVAIPSVNPDQARNVRSAVRGAGLRLAWLASPAKAALAWPRTCLTAATRRARALRTNPGC